MNRDEFMELVYETFADEPDNVLANGIIEAADAYAEHEKAQLSQEGTTSDLISRQQALKALIYAVKNVGVLDANDIRTVFKALPTIQPERKKDEWIRNDNGTYSCSVCQSWIPEEQHYYARYCLCCGADLRGKKDG